MSLGSQTHHCSSTGPSQMPHMHSYMQPPLLPLLHQLLEAPLGNLFHFMVAFRGVFRFDHFISEAKSSCNLISYLQTAKVI